MTTNYERNKKPHEISDHIKTLLETFKAILLLGHYYTFFHLFIAVFVKRGSYKFETIKLLKITPHILKYKIYYLNILMLKVVYKVQNYI